MAAHVKMPAGSIGWIDLTVPDAESISDFYEKVAGWRKEAVKMDDYQDYNMKRSDGAVTSGICHARGGNASMPAQWMIYIVVDDIDASMKACTDGGGAIVEDTYHTGSEGRYCVIRDPAGAVCALYEPA